MMRYIGTRIIHTAMTAAALMLLSSCDGILGSVYDEPVEEIAPTAAGELYIDASDWKEWHYIDLPSVAAVAAADPLLQHLGGLGDVPGTGGADL